MRPSPPTGLHATVSDDTVVLGWHASTENVGYVLTVDGGVYGAVGVTDITIRNMTFGTHTVSVVAVDGAEHRSQPSEPVTFVVGVVPSGDVLQEWLNRVFPLIVSTTQYQKWVASATKVGRADVARWDAYLASPHAAPPAMATPYGKALVADLSLAAAQP